MAYIALYREWRPKAFADIIGQEHICKTLQNAIETGRVAHAYLFCGPRGTGKTSTAKVLAKALNCLAGPSVEPCNGCDNCKRINEGTSYDVIEIDAASNRGIDEIRDLREKVKYAPAEGKYKVYIIDEVHMLTTEAFNALLKTLEEPPRHVIFVLATTEPHKIPLTILSRCQRFDFRRIGLSDTIARLKHIATHEQIDISEDALRIIARRAEGGMRDALSILDQCISFGGKSISVQDITTILGTVNEELLQRISGAIIEKNTTLCLQLVDDMLREGKDARQFIKDLIEYFRNLLLVKVCEQVEGLVNVSESALEILRQQAGQVARESILAIIDILADKEKEMKWTTQPRLMLEVAVIKASQPDKDIKAVPQQVITAAQNQIAKENKTTGKKEKAVQAHTTAPLQMKKEEGETQTFNIKSDINSDDPEGVGKIKEAWGTVISTLRKERKMTISAFLLECQPIAINNKVLLLGFKKGHDFHKEQVEKPDNKKEIERVINKVTGQDLLIKCIMGNQPLAEEVPPAAQSKPPEQDSLVQEAIRFFGGDVIEIND